MPSQTISSIRPPTSPWLDRPPAPAVPRPTGRPRPLAPGAAGDLGTPRLPGDPCGLELVQLRPAGEGLEQPVERGARLGRVGLALHQADEHGPVVQEEGGDAEG